MHGEMLMNKWECIGLAAVAIAFFVCMACVQIFGK